MKITKSHTSEDLPASQQQETVEFLEKLPSYPLDIAVAAYYLKTTNVSYEKYLKTMQENSKNFRNLQENLLKEAGAPPKTRYGIMTLSLQNLIKTDERFEGILFLLSLLDSQNIPREMLDEYQRDVVIDNFIYNLRKHSLITDERDSSSLGKRVSLHRSTQDIIRAYFSTTLDALTRKKIIQKGSKALVNHADKTISKEDFPKMELIASHLRAFLSHRDLLPTETRAVLKSKLGSIFYHFRNYAKSKTLLEESLEDFREANLAQDKRILEILLYLAAINMELGNHEEAKELAERCLKGYQPYFSEMDLATVKALVGIGDVYGAVGEYEKSQEILEKALLAYRKLFPEGSKEIGSQERSPLGARALVLLGNTHWCKGEYVQAKDYFEESLKLFKKLFPENSFDIAAVQAFLGNSYVSLGEYKKGKEILEKGIAMYKENLPENHLDLAWASVYLAHAEECLGNLKEAKILLEKSLSAHKNVVGEENVRSAWVLWHLGKVDTSLGYYDEANASLEKALHAYEKEYGDKHIETSHVLIDLGQLQRVTHNFGGAEQSLKRAFKILQASDHTDQYMALEELSELYLEKAAKDNEGAKIYKKRAEELLKQAFEVVRGRFSENSPHAKRLNLKLKNMSF
jgi:tetratricopeptide (TPR) repeat protein